MSASKILEKAAVKSVVNEVLNERIKQIQKCGNESDDKLQPFLLAGGAMTYIYGAAMQFYSPEHVKNIDLQHWGFQSPPRFEGVRKNMIKAAAMLIAEIERLDRVGMEVDEDE